MSEITIAPCKDLAGLASRWRALDAISDGGFFRSWCFLAAQAGRFDNPYLLAVRQNGTDAALALMNKRRGRFYLGETGDAARDALFIEHNGLLVRTGAEHVMAPAMAAICRMAPLVLSGVDQAQFAAATRAGLVVHRATRFAPAVALPAPGGDYVATLSANARAQIRRAIRLYGNDLSLTAAPDVASALRYFGALVELHQARWRLAGKQGAFADTGLRQFHEALIMAAHPAGQADLLRVTAAGQDVGYLYNLRERGRVFAYQSGFAPTGDARKKPGLVCHTLAIEYYQRGGAHCYDLLGGAERYKTTLAPHGGQNLHWITLYDRASVRGRALIAARSAWAWARG